MVISYPATYWVSKDRLLGGVVVVIICFGAVCNVIFHRLSRTYMTFYLKINAQENDNINFTMLEKE